MTTGLLAGLDAGKKSDFMIRFAEHADLSAAKSIKDWNQRGQYVVQQLQRAAEEGQRATRAAALQTVVGRSLSRNPPVRRRG